MKRLMRTVLNWVRSKNEPDLGDDTEFWETVSTYGEGYENE